MTSGATAENRVQEVSQISRNLKVLARDLEVPILALSQLSRAVEQRHDKRPILSDLRESGSIEQDADLVAFVYRDEYYNGEESDQQGLAEVIVAKHRNGPTDMVKLSFLKRYAKFADLAGVKPGESERGRRRTGPAMMEQTIWVSPRATAFTAVCEACAEQQLGVESWLARDGRGHAAPRRRPRQRQLRARARAPDRAREPRADRRLLGRRSRKAWRHQVAAVRAARLSSG